MLPDVIWFWLYVHDKPAGSPVHAPMFTLLVNVFPLAGEINMVVEVNCPGFAAAGFVSVPGTVKS